MPSILDGDTAYLLVAVLKTMKITTRSRYGTRMMVELAVNFPKGPIQVGEIAKKENLSVKYLEQLIIPLKRTGLVKSIRGPKGGYLLTRPPTTITIWDIITALEGDKGVTPCVTYPEWCDRSEDCPTRHVWSLMTDTLKRKLSTITLADLAEKQGKKLCP